MTIKFCSAKSVTHRFERQPFQILLLLLFLLLFIIGPGHNHENVAKHLLRVSLE